MITTLNHYCLAGPKCADRIDGHARETMSPGTFCDRCLARTSGRVARLPEQYLRLHAMIGERHAGVDPGIRRPKPGSTVPINLHIDTLLGDIADTTTLAAEVLADAMGMDNPDRHPTAVQVAACTAIVAPNITRLLPMTEIEVMTWLVTESRYGVDTTTGAFIVGRLDRLASLAHYALGLTRSRAERDLPCNRCGAKTVGRWAGSDNFDCSTCGAHFPEDDIRRQDKILLELCKRGKVSFK